MDKIELSIKGKKALYDSSTNTVCFWTKNGACIEAEVPKDWALTRIFQFMESLFKADSVII